jgi:hypothetical protein
MPLYYVYIACKIYPVVYLYNVLAVLKPYEENMLYNYLVAFCFLYIHIFDSYFKAGNIYLWVICCIYYLYKLCFNPGIFVTRFQLSAIVNILIRLNKNKNNRTTLKTVTSHLRHNDVTHKQIVVTLKAHLWYKIYD